MVKKIEHEGIVASVSGNTMMVRIVSSSACNGCTAKSHCVPSENKDMDIRVEEFSGEFVLGEKVMVTLQQRMGFKALCIGYLIPFMLVLITLVAVCLATGNELVGGLAALLILLPYYLVIKLMDHKIDKIFGFTVEKIN